LDRQLATLADLPVVRSLRSRQIHLVHDRFCVGICWVVLSFPQRQPGGSALCNHSYRLPVSLLRDSPDSPLSPSDRAGNGFVGGIRNNTDIFSFVFRKVTRLTFTKEAVPPSATLPARSEAGSSHGKCQPQGLAASELSDGYHHTSTCRNFLMVGSLRIDLSCNSHLVYMPEVTVRM
jgi:hypothetical protein